MENDSGERMLRWYNFYYIAQWAFLLSFQQNDFRFGRWVVGLEVAGSLGPEGVLMLSAPC